MSVIKRYRVWGEFGPLAGQYIEQEIRAKTPKNAKNRFIRYLKREHTHTWERIGERNVYVEEIVE